MGSRVIARAVAVLALVCSFALPVSAQDDYRFGAQDVVRITIFGQGGLSERFTVEADGTFTFPIFGRIKAGGLTLRAFEAELRQRLADGYFRNPQVSVAVEQYRSQRVFVMGEVRQPGPVALTGGMTLIEALARAGSTLSTASGEVAVVRAPQGNVNRGPLLPDQDAATEVFRASIRELDAQLAKL